MAVLRALGWKKDDPRLTIRGAILGSSAVGRSVTSGIMDRLVIGAVRLSNVPIYCSRDDSDTPTMLLGCDLLNLLEGYAVDFGRPELQILVPPTAPARS